MLKFLLVYLLASSVLAKPDSLEASVECSDQCAKRWSKCAQSHYASEHSRRLLALDRRAQGQEQQRPELTIKPCCRKGDVCAPVNPGHYLCIPPFVAHYKRVWLQQALSCGARPHLLPRHEVVTLRFLSDLQHDAAQQVATRECRWHGGCQVASAALYVCNTTGTGRPGP
jgi:hypothetical protein